jgi:hypothetical protein
MTHRHITTLCLLAFAAAHVAALATPFVSVAAADCCSGNLCPMQKPASKDSSDCHHSSDASGCACSISAGQVPQSAVIGQQPYVLASGVILGLEHPVEAAPAQISLAAPTTALEIESPPPRTILA